MKRSKLFSNAVREGCHGRVFDIPNEVLHAISSASASIVDGTWENVLRVSVPSYERVRSNSIRGRPDLENTHIFDLFDSKICIRWDSDGLRSDATRQR